MLKSNFKKQERQESADNTEQSNIPTASNSVGTGKARKLVNLVILVLCCGLVFYFLFFQEEGEKIVEYDPKDTQLDLQKELESSPPPEDPNFNDIDDFSIKKFKNYRDEITKHSIYFNPTQRSPMPRSRGEALMSGLVSVSADNHDVSRFIQSGVDGFYSKDKAEVYDALKFVAKNNQARRKMQIKSRDLAVKYFSLDRYHQEWTNVVKEYI